MAIDAFLIDENQTILEAMRQLDLVAKKVLFVLRDGHFVACLTDGDIRRWLLKKGDLAAEIKLIANYNPKYLMLDEKHTAKEYMRTNSIEALPILGEEKKIASIVFWDDTEVNVKGNLVAPVVIMAGGLGTRLYPYTKILPKPLIPVGEIPIIEHIINRFNKQGSSEFYLIVNHKKNMIKAYLNDIQRAYSLSYIDEDIPLGTGGGLSLLKNKINQPFILSNCDILIDSDYEKIYKHHMKEGNFITMVCSLKNMKIPYGVIEISEDGGIEEMREKPEISFFTNTGMYIVDHQVIDDLEYNRPIDFPDIIERYRDVGEKIGVYPISENSWLDMGQLDELEEMRRRLEDE
jgi:dTDP-glucose pyrophosphorylase/CBS domain-containing protein